MHSGRTPPYYRLLSIPWLYDAVQHLMGASRGRRLLIEQILRPSAGDRILDFGCGTAAIVAYLPDKVEYLGFDVNRDYIHAARRRFGQRARFVQGELTEEILSREPKFDVVLGIGVLHHLEDAEASKFLSLARFALREKGRLITIDPCYAPGQPVVARILIGWDRGSSVRKAEAYRALAESSFARVRGEIRHRRWIPYTHWVMECWSG